MDFKSLNRYFLANYPQEKLFDLDQLQQFLAENGCINPTASFFYCRVYLYQVYQGKARRKKFLTESEFYLMVAQVTGTFDLFDPQLRITANQNHPMTDYFIASSSKFISTPSAHKWKSVFSGSGSVKHHQLKQYRRLLEAGCRCLEIEVWDRCDVRRIKAQKGGSNGAFISLSSVLNEINSFAVHQQQRSFGHLPIVLSIDYSSLKQSSEGQEELAHQLKSVFKERLYTESVNFNKIKEFPSPEKLKNYIFVMPINQENIDYALEETCKSVHSERKNIYLVVNTGKMFIKKTLATAANDSNNENLQTSQTSLLADSLAELTNYFTNYSFKNDIDFQNLLLHTSFNETISIDEGTLRRAIAFGSEQQSSHHNNLVSKSRMVHAYQNFKTPGQIYDPLPLWAAGVQLVALNWNLQSKLKKRHFFDDGIPAALNEALFELGGFCGYVLKPPFLTLSSTLSFEPKTYLSITICSAVLPTTEKRCSLKDEFVVEVKLYGNAHCTWPISKPLEWSTRLLSVEAGGKKHSEHLVLTWNENMIGNVDELTMVTAELTFVLFKLEKNGQLYGRKMIALKAMQTGFRSIRLTDVATVRKSSSKNPAILVVNVQRQSSEERVDNK